MPVFPLTADDRAQMDYFWYVLECSAIYFISFPTHRPCFVDRN